jgi:sensor c-di-GMP phosphodiesterase-like protein
MVRKRHTITFASIVTFAICVSIAGFYLARGMVAWVTTARLDSYASQLMTNSDNWAAEVRTALAAVDASPSLSCSSAEVKYLRALIFDSEFLKDAGWMRGDGQVECSAAMGTVTRSLKQTRPDFTQRDGTRIYTNLKPYQDSLFPVLTLQRGRSFVAFTPFVRMYVKPPPLHFTQTVIDEPTQKRGSLVGEPLPEQLPILREEGVLWSKDRLYVTHCSTRYFDCVTAYTSLPEVIAAHGSRFNAFVAASGLVGGCMGWVFSLLYHRNKSLEKQLRRAIRRNELQVAYQPVVSLPGGHIVGAEALARWNDEEGNPVGPDVFIHLAQQHGFVKEITRLVLRRVFDELGAALRNNSGLCVAINVTADDLADRDFPALLDAVLALSAVPPQSLALEITESSTVRRETAIAAIRKLRQRGHKVYIDDFGTGYSSLAYLQDLSVDAIKIDRAFTQSIGTGSVTMAILPQILALAEALKLKVIVEGVETAEQAAYFSAVNQPMLAQGWLFGRPMRAAEFYRALDEQRLAMAARPRIKIVNIA